ncbi:hypothetical protein HanXRQr2_Chr05g0196871 [Helianthus annuus]|uniref:Uncharacterized protein n=1 Tax=Helianthus annuus TaxID=4232 RepID=A0A9K3NL76_HELAN|nr:hypothetical protein HanXRQr2_Chr05g0196871 [Helianthus annuus]KAJ0921326.1 hypothetical protein HanPSC8_Chr05g0190171 [Helianthus annuus]
MFSGFYLRLQLLSFCILTEKLSPVCGVSYTSLDNLYYWTVQVDQKQNDT